MPPPTVRVGTVAVKNVPVYGEFVGQTDAKETVNIVSRVTGYLEKIVFQDGSQAHKETACILSRCRARRCCRQSALFRTKAIWYSIHSAGSGSTLVAARQLRRRFLPGI